MINFSAISNSKLADRALRLPLRLIPDSTAVRIFQGPLRSKRWIAGSCNHGCWLGSYELPKQERVIEFLKVRFSLSNLCRATSICYGGMFR